MKSTIKDIENLPDYLRRDVYELCQPEGRMVGSKGHQIAEEFVRRRLYETNCSPYKGDCFDLPYHRFSTDFTNFASVIPGKNRNLAPLLIGAHYDSVIAAPCADDNGAAVAICLAIADIASSANCLDRDLIIAIFDAEEPPYFLGEAMGSNRFYLDEIDDRGIHFAMIHDLVGHDVSVPLDSIPGAAKLFGKKDMGLPLLKDALFMTGAESHPELQHLVADAGIPEKIKLGATLNRYIGDMSDHSIFRKNRVPYLFFSCGWWKHYHQPTDTPDRLNYNKVARIARLSWDVLQQVDKSQLTEPSGKEGDFTLDYEISTLKGLLGPLLPILLKMARVKQLSSRQDIEKVVEKMVGGLLRGGY